MHPLPFEEHETAARARAVARRLGASTLGLYVTGRPGTGRRTLARELADARTADGRMVEVRGGEALPPVARGDVVLLHHPELLDSASQVRIAGWCGDGVRLVAWGPMGFVEDSHPELRAHLASGQVMLPPLDNRGADAVAWARLFVARHGQTTTLAPDAERALAGRSWPGNLTQLEGEIVRALALREEGAEHPLCARDFQLEVTPSDLETLSDAMERFRREYVVRALERFGGNRTRTARALGVDPRTVFRYLVNLKDDVE